jgi:uncharacterized membrane protein YphA (DoxX/SURF4 family)
MYASLTKIPDPAVFAENVAAYQIVPYWAINVVAVFLPMFELLTGGMLILGVKTKAVASLLSSLLVMYTLMTLITVMRGVSISCGCYDVVGDPVTGKKVIIDFVYTLMMIQAFFYDKIDLFNWSWLTLKRKS